MAECQGPPKKGERKKREKKKGRKERRKNKKIKKGRVSHGRWAHTIFWHGAYHVICTSEGSRRPGKILPGAYSVLLYSYGPELHASEFGSVGFRLDPSFELVRLLAGYLCLIPT